MHPSGWLRSAVSTPNLLRPHHSTLPTPDPYLSFSLGSSLCWPVTPSSLWLQDGWGPLYVCRVLRAQGRKAPRWATSPAFAFPQSPSWPAFGIFPGTVITLCSACARGEGFCRLLLHHRCNSAWHLVGAQQMCCCMRFGLPECSSLPGALITLLPYPLHSSKAPSSRKLTLSHLPGRIKQFFSVLRTPCPHSGARQAASVSRWGRCAGSSQGQGPRLISLFKSTGLAQ